MSAKNEMQKSAESNTGFSVEEKSAMKARVNELKAEARASKNKVEGENAADAVIAAMQGSDHKIAARLHEIIKASAPSLSAKTWYGMPAYADEDGQVIAFFQSAQKFNSRYAVLGFTDKANLDEGEIWPTTFAVKELTADIEAKIIQLIKKAVN
jgi:uncharacterized protein YdhG (YjbR/CyaY superfamily)